MHNFVRLSCVFPVVLFCAATAYAQAPDDAAAAQHFIRPAQQYKTGTARIRGRVVAFETGAPIRSAQVTISGLSIGSKNTITDAQGWFEVASLPAGRFTISATKAGFVTVHYGQDHPTDLPRSVDISEGQIFDKVNLRMPLGGVITGQIVDEFGDSVTNATVVAHRETWQDGRRRFVPTGRPAQTNDLGQYRVFSLPPGEYFVSAILRPPEMSVPGVKVAEVAEVRENGQAQTDYAPTYFPGVTSPEFAQKVRVAIAQNAAPTDFPLRLVKLARITGTVRDSSGAPLGGIPVTAVVGGTATPGAMLSLTTLTEDDGSFALANVVPGEYTIQAQWVTHGTDDGAVRAYTEYGFVSLLVASDAVEDVLIALKKDGTARGRVVFEGTPPGTGLATIRVRNIAALPESSLPVPPTTVAADGTFEVTGIVGPQLFGLDGLPEGWTLKAVTLSGEDVTDRPVAIEPGQVIAGVTLVAAPKSGLQGTVKRPSGSPVRDCTIIAFAENSEKWRLPGGRWVAGTRSDEEGGFRIEPLPAGSYFVAVMDYAPQDQWGDPDFLQRLKVSATRVSVGKGNSETLALTLRER